MGVVFLPLPSPPSSPPPPTWLEIEGAAWLSRSSPDQAGPGTVAHFSLATRSLYLGGSGATMEANAHLSGLSGLTSRLGLLDHGAGPVSTLRGCQAGRQLGPRKRGLGRWRARLTGGRTLLCVLHYKHTHINTHTHIHKSGRRNR